MAQPAARQLTGDNLLDRFDVIERRRTFARPELAKRRFDRLVQTASGFFRGAPAFFYDLLRTHPGVRRVLGRERRWIVGDVHLENIGVIAIGQGRLVWDFNDLDEACEHGPALDVLRGTASAAVAAMDLGFGTNAAVRAAEAFMQAYFRPVAVEAPRVVTDLIARAADRTEREMLDERCPSRRGQRHFVLGKRYLELTTEEQRVVTALFAAFRRDDPLALGKSLRLEAAAFRVQGTGSLGVRRFVMLVSWRLRTDGLLLEAKEMRPSAVERGGLARLDTTRGGQAARVIAASEALLSAPLEGARAIMGVDGRSYLLRKHAPGEDKLALTSLRTADELVALARSIGYRLFCAHGRGSRQPFLPAIDSQRVLAMSLDLAGAMIRAHLALVQRASAGATTSST